MMNFQLGVFNFERIEFSCERRFEMYDTTVHTLCLHDLQCDSSIVNRIANRTILRIKTETNSLPSDSTVEYSNGLKNPYFQFQLIYTMTIFDSIDSTTLISIRWLQFF